MNFIFTATASSEDTYQSLMVYSLLASGHDLVALWLSPQTCHQRQPHSRAADSDPTSSRCQPAHPRTRCQNRTRSQERTSYPTSVYKINTFDILCIFADIRDKKHRSWPMSVTTVSIWNFDLLYCWPWLQYRWQYRRTYVDIGWKGAVFLFFVGHGLMDW